MSAARVVVALRRRSIALTMTLAGSLGALPVHAQVTTALTGLSFGTILSGTTTSVLPTATGAMSFSVTAAFGVQSTLTLTLPTSLSRVGGGGTMPITFCTTCGVHRQNNNNPVGGTVFNPATTVNISSVGTATQYVWLGASVSPPLAQAPGSYTATIVLTYAKVI